MGRKQTEATKKKIRETLKGRRCSPIGYKHSEETKAKLRAAWIKKERTPLEKLTAFSSIRKKLFELRGRKCETCGWCKINEHNGIVPVQIRHKNGDNKDNRLENLIILCPNCHSLTKYFMFYGRKHKDRELGSDRSPKPVLQGSIP